MNVLIYSERSSNRLQYILGFFFTRIYKWEYRITNSISEFESADQPKFVYGSRPVDNALFIYSNGLLFEADVKEQDPDVFNWDDTAVFFKSPYSALVPLDIFSAAFFLISRYEEYLPFISDNHGRFRASESFALRNNFLEDPVVDIWALRLQKILAETFGVVPVAPKYEFVSTIDVDNAYAYLGKGFFRTAAALVRSLFTFRKNEFLDRLGVLIGREKDPYGTYGILDRWHEEYGIKAIYFFLLGHYARYDKNLPVNSRILGDIIKRSGDKYELGIHPSYASNSEAELMQVELKHLERLSLRKISHSRQHFLKLNFPKTYRSLNEIGIRHDHSMGYADHIGFRAGTCRSFMFFDLELNESTKLEIHPFAVMDATLNMYMKLGPDSAVWRTQKLISKVKKTGGTFEILWHNESLSEMYHWRGWRDVYARILKYGRSD